MRILFSIICCFALSLVLFLFYQKTQDPLLNIDFLQYWSSARLILEGANPYNQDLLRALEQSVWRFSGKDFKTITMWNPPLIIPLILPFGLLSFEAATFFWAIFLTVAIALSIHLSAQLVQAELNDKIGIVALITFYPIISTYYFGQISPILLLGLVLFLWLSRLEKYFYSGACLALTLIKPHLLFLIYLWILTRQERLKIVAGLLCGASVLALAALFASPNIFANYTDLISKPPIHWHTPTLGSWLQGASPESGSWPRFIPMVITTLIFLYITLRNGDRRGGFFQRDGAIFALIPLSLFMSPYGWVYDQILIIPTVIWLLFTTPSEKSGSLRYIPFYVIAANFLAWLPLWTAQHHYVWHPLAFLLLSCLRLRTTAAVKTN